MPDSAIDSIIDVANLLKTGALESDSAFNSFVLQIDSLKSSVASLSSQFSNGSFDWMELIPPLVYLLGIILTIYAVNKRSKREMDVRIQQIREEFLLKQKEQDLSITKLILPNCLEVLQAVFTHTMTINSLLNEVSGLFSTENVDDSKLKVMEAKFHEELRTLRKWYDQNCLYLPSEIRKDFVGLLNISHMHISELFNSANIRAGNRSAWDKYMTVSRSVEQGISKFMERYNLIDRIINEEI